MYIRDKPEFKNALSALLWYGGLHLLIGVVIFLMRQSDDATFNAISIIVSGAIFLGLRFWARNGSKTPFWIGIVFTALGMLANILTGSYRGLIVGAIVVYRLWEGTKVEGKLLPSTAIDNNNDAPLDSGL